MGQHSQRQQVNNQSASYSDLSNVYEVGCIPHEGCTLLHGCQQSGGYKKKELFYSRYLPTYYYVFL